MELMALEEKKGISLSLSSLPAIQGRREEAAICKPERGLQPETELAHTLILFF